MNRILSVDGNVEPEQSAKNVLRLDENLIVVIQKNASLKLIFNRLLKANNRDDIPVFVGQKVPFLMTQPVEKGYWFGKDGLNDKPDVEPTADSIKERI